MLFRVAGLEDVLEVSFREGRNEEVLVCWNSGIASLQSVIRSAYTLKRLEPVLPRSFTKI